MALTKTGHQKETYKIFSFTGNLEPSGAKFGSVATPLLGSFVKSCFLLDSHDDVSTSETEFASGAYKRPYKPD